MRANNISVFSKLAQHLENYVADDKGSIKTSKIDLLMG